VGIVTSPTGAAIRDMINILRRRAPWVRIILNPVRVQGEGAALEMVDAIADFNDWKAREIPRPDVLIVGRGGGSTEDLWEFNEEALARAIAASEIPVVSAVGHEIDFTIADFVADLRAPTPSAAAELVVPDAAETLRRFGHLEAQMRRSVSSFVESRSARMEILSRGLAILDPARRIADCSQELDALREAMDRLVGERTRDFRHRLAGLLAGVLQHRPDQMLLLMKSNLGVLAEKLGTGFSTRLQSGRQRVSGLAAVLRVLGPQATLERGYSITMKEDGTLVRSKGDVDAGAVILTKVKDGSFRSTVK
jgi:exodeoxyribonuclease VII large subunit